MIWTKIDDHAIKSGEWTISRCYTGRGWKHILYKRSVYKGEHDSQAQAKAAAK